MSSNQISNCLNRAINKLKDSQFPLKPYQVVGVKWMISQELEATYKGGILADDPGLGKTIQTAGLLAAVEKSKTLIIVPGSVIFQWKDTLSKIFGSDSVYVYHGSNKPKTAASLLQKSFKICITSHGSCFRVISKDIMEQMGNNSLNLLKTPLHYILWDRVIIDEAHVIRNKNTKIHQACAMYRNSFNSMWGLTGTPIQNKEQDAISLLTYIGIPAGQANVNVEKLLQKYLLRRTKQLLVDKKLLIDYQVQNHQLPFKTIEEQEFYQTVQQDALQELLNADAQDMDEHSLNMLMLELLLRLRQTASHPKIVVDSLTKKFGKLNFEINFDLNSISTKIDSVVSEINKSKNLCLVFGHFRHEMKLLQHFLNKKHGIQAELYDGSLSLQQRNDLLSKCKKDKPIKKLLVKQSNGKRKLLESSPRVLIIQIKAGGVGLNLQQFKDVFLLAPDWNPANEIQAIARAHRLGQDGKVNVHKYTINCNPAFNKDEFSTIDERILEIQMKKRDIMVNLLKDDTLEFNEKFIGKIPKLTRSDMRYMITGSSGRSSSGKRLVIRRSNIANPNDAMPE